MITIAIDGYSSTGKSTMARNLASSLGYRYIDTGAMYRAVTLYALDKGLIDENGLIDTPRLILALPTIDIDFKVMPDGTQHTMLNGVSVENKIRSMNVSRHVSSIAAISEVRSALVDCQRLLGNDGGVVMDGRDIGSVVFPNAGLKFFVTASPYIRARRRYDELVAKGTPVSFDEVYDNIVKRDTLDETRQVSPLVCVPDAIRIDNSDLSPIQQDDMLLSISRKRISEIEGEQ